MEASRCRVDAVGTALVGVLVVGGCSDTSPPPEASDGLDCDSLMRVTAYVDTAAGDARGESTPEDAARGAAAGTPVVEDGVENSSSARVLMDSGGRALAYVEVRRDVDGVWFADSTTKCAD